MIFGKQGGPSLFFQELIARYLYRPVAFLDHEHSGFQPATIQAARFFLIESFDSTATFKGR